MCFSAEASFASTLVISLIGIYGLTCVKSARQLPLAILPFFFALHQALEGILWLYLRDRSVSTSLALMAQQGYVFFAYLFFPIYFPFIAWMWETSTTRRMWIAVFLFVGVCVALAHVERLGWQTIVAKQVGSSIQYPYIGPETGIPYLCAVSIPFFLCHDRKMWGVGILAITSFFFALYIFYLTTASVWCFCAAWMSLYGLLMLKRGDKESPTRN